MILKKSDKMIAIIGIVILIVAAISIIYYVYEEDEGETREQKKKTFEVKWIRDEGNMEIPGDTGRQSYTNPFTVTASRLKSNSVLTHVYVRIDWTDDFTKGKILNKGEDTLTANIALTGREPQTHKSTGSGNETLTFNIYSKPQDVTIEEDDIETVSDVELKIADEYGDMNSASFEVEVKWEKGEKLLTLRLVKLINYFRDRGNDFTLYINYEYYYPVVYKIGDGDNGSNDDNPPTGMNKEENKGTVTYSTLALPGFH